ncbi:MAG: Vitamin B12 transporter BtuB [Steroidobacteraceae bacterium]|nr:Vitamin B12 transporter BtuB [Steroidobacteraceae bacterium]
MQSKPVHTAIRRALIAGAAAMLTLPAATIAQAQNDQGDDVETVVVTGSRILGSNLESPSPIQTVTAEDIQTSGVPNIQDLLVKSPVFGTPLSRTNSNFLTSSVGVATIDLRNLGTARTLVLVDGRRFVAGIPGESAVDLNTIPASFIDRVDVMTGGASSIYGSDAIAGVVNIIYKKNFEGFSFDAQYGESAEGDGDETQLGATFGVSSADGRGNVMGYIGYTDQGSVLSRDRSRSAVDQISTALLTGDPADMFTPQRPFYSSYAPQGRFFTANGPGSGITFDANGNVIPWSTNGTSTLAATGFNRSAFRTIAVPIERYLFASRGNYEFADHHRAFFEGTYASTQATSVLEPYPLGAEDIYPATGGQTPAEFLVNGVLLANPLIPAAVFNTTADEDGDGLRDYYFTRRMAEAGNRGSVADRDTFRIVGGLEGELFGGGWRYEAFYAYGQTKEAQTSSGQVNVLNFRNALEAIPDVDDLDGDGNVTEAICRDANARSQGCVPINVFGFNSISPAAFDYIKAPGMLATFTQQKIAGLNLTGHVFDLPAGPVGLAVGAEYRDEYSRSEFDPLQQAGLNAGNAIPRTEGDFDVKEGYLEVRVPLLADKPMFEKLDINGAVRFADYSTVGSVVSWNGGLEWSPIPSLRFRAIRALATRAPNINELFSPPSQDFPTGLQDPCVGVTATSTGDVDAACRAAPGVNANIAANGAFTLNQADIQGISGFNRGNPNLSEEEGDSWTVGVVIKPSDIPVLENFDLTLDYYRIDIKDAIVFTPRQFILDQCYRGNTALCQFITRRPAAVGANSAGSLEFIDSGPTNSGGEFAEGIDLTVSYAQDIGPGAFRGRLAFTHVLDQYRVPLPGAAKDYIVGEVEDGLVAPENRAVLNLGYTVGKFGATLTTTYLGKVALDDQFLAQFGEARGSIGVGSKTYLDAQVTYSPTENYQIFVGANNLLDEEPPPIISGLPGDDTGTETNAGAYDPIGRRWYAGVRVKL